MESHLPQFALALFDLDGCTVVVDTKKLHSEGKIAKGKSVEFHHCKQIYKVEVLEFSDSKVKLNKFEDDWSTSARSKALDKAKEERDDYGGFLSVIPTEDEEEDLVLTGVENQEHVEVNVIIVDGGLQVLEDAKTSTKSTVTNRSSKSTATKESTKSIATKDSSKSTASKSTATKESSKSTTSKSTATKESSKSTTSKSTATKESSKSTTSKSTATKESSKSSAKEGQNGRKINVCFEGAGDDTDNICLPKRKPAFLEGLQDDEVDLINIQVSDHLSGKKSTSTQTDPVVIITAEDDPRQMFQKGTRDVGVQCESDFIDSKVHGLSLQLTAILNMLSAIETDKLNPMFNILKTFPTHMELDLSEVFRSLTDQQSTTCSTVPACSETQPVLAGQEVMDVKDQACTSPPPIDDIHTVVSPIIKDHTGTAPPPIDDIHTVVSPIIKDYTGTAPPPIDDIHNVVSPVIKDHTATFIPAGLDHAQHVDLPTQMNSSSPLLVLGNLTETTPNGSALRPAQMTSSLGNCFDGSLVEVESFADMKDIPRDAEVRVRQQVINKTINSSCSTGNFAWTLAQRLFNENELFGRNYRGKRGKLALSPRRTHAIEHCVVACYGDNFDNLGESRRAIDTGIRNMKFKTKCRKDLYPL